MQPKARARIVVDGAGYTLQGTGSGRGINLAGRNNVTIKNMGINGFDQGICCLHGSSNNTLVGNTISLNTVGGFGIFFMYSSGNIVIDNIVVGNPSLGMNGTVLWCSDNNIFNNNIFSNNLFGIGLLYSNNNSLTGNTISSNTWYGITVTLGSIDNLIYHNNIIDNPNQAFDTSASRNDWHHPALLEGNYWSDYAGVDDGSGVGKHAIAGDGIGDTLIPHPDTDYDFYPLMNPWTPPTPPVGGIYIPANKLELLAPYIGLTILLAVAVVTVVYVKKTKRNTEINS